MLVSDETTVEVVDDCTSMSVLVCVVGIVVGLGEEINWEHADEMSLGDAPEMPVGSALTACRLFREVKVVVVENVLELMVVLIEVTVASAVLVLVMDVEEMTVLVEVSVAVRVSVITLVEVLVDVNVLN